MLPQGHQWGWADPTAWSAAAAAAAVQRGIGDAGGVRCGPFAAGRQPLRGRRLGAGRDRPGHMAKRGPMYPGLNQADFPSMLDERMYAQLLPPGPSVEHGGVVKICGVCSDRAKSLHFGGMACDSCKAFFRRSVQNEAYKHFRCSYEGRCSITITSRKCCQYC
ncbi:nuclear hormone receptor family member nhr-23-like, partial [Amphibalanus amphitrite]|uniref:nuclear hormone receptor family member nhr-23-like n=1 Tax=Amphibalanus amphitrite TaxID=1232801 RepID=UPI001C91411B